MIQVMDMVGESQHAYCPLQKNGLRLVGLGAGLTTQAGAQPAPGGASPEPGGGQAGGGTRALACIPAAWAAPACQRQPVWAA